MINSTEHSLSWETVTQLWTFIEPAGSLLCQQDPATSAHPKPDDSSHPISPRSTLTYLTISDQVFMTFLYKLLKTLHMWTLKCHLFTAVPINHTFCVCVCVCVVQSHLSNSNLYNSNSWIIRSFLWVPWQLYTYCITFLILIFG